MNQDLICLSSDEDEPSAKKTKCDGEQATKRTKQINSIDKEKDLNEKIICLDSDEDNDSQDVIIISKEDLKTNTSTELSPKISADELNKIEVINWASPSTLNLSNGSSKNSKDLEELESSDNDTSEIEDCEEEIQCNEKENKQRSQLEDQNNSSTSRNSYLMADTEDLPIEATKFLSTCEKILPKESAEPIFKKFPIIIKMFRSLSEEFSRSEYLKKFIRKQTKIARESVSCCIISFRDVYQHLKDSLNSQSIELPKKHWKHVRKLEKVMQQLLAKLKELEEAEIDFDEDEDNSAYIKHDKYSQRLSKVYKKYCEILKKNPYSGRITHERLDFVSSNYNEINHAISKKYKNNDKFPSYDELVALIQKVVEDKKLPLSNSEVKVESEHCFKKLGDLLQIRRKKELYEAHQKYMIEEDPAKGNEELEKRLRISFKEGKVRIEQICQEYVKKQELGLVGEEIDLSDTENFDDENQSDDEDIL